MRYLGGPDLRYAHVVELLQYSTFDKVCVIAHKLEQQKKAYALKRNFPKSQPKSHPFSKGSSFWPPKPAVLIASAPGKNQTP